MTSSDPSPRIYSHFSTTLPLAAQAHFVTAASGLLRFAAARHAAHVHSRVGRARPGIGTCQCRASAASVTCAKTRKPAKSPKSRVWRPPQPAYRYATRPVTRPALTPMCLGHGPMPYVRVLCSYDAHTGEEMHGWSVVELGSRVGSVEGMC